MKKSLLALALAAVMLAAMFAACGKPARPQPTTPAQQTDAQGNPVPLTLPPIPSQSNPSGSPSDPSGAPSGYQPGQAYQPVTLPSAPTVAVTEGSSYRSPAQIPVKSEGKPAALSGVPEGVAEIYAIDGKLLFSYVTRREAGKTGEPAEYYTLFAYDPESKGCVAVSEEVGYIMRLGDRFLYEKTGVAPGSADFWDVPYYLNTPAWNNEIEITGALAKQLLSQPKTAKIGGKAQPYVAQRAGTAITLTLPETGEVLALRLDPKAAFGQQSPDGLIVDIRGVADDHIYLSAVYVPENGLYTRELFSMKLDGSGLTPLRYGSYPVWADPTLEAENGCLYGIASTGKGTAKGTALLKINTATNEVIHLATVKQSVWHFVATDDCVLYEIPSKDAKKGNGLGCVKVEK